MISSEDVRRLVDAEDPDATLVMIEGRPVVRSGDAEGLSVISKADLLAQAGERLDNARGVEEVAAELDVVVRELGG